MLTLDFNPFPVLHTPRLLLRRPILTDADDLFEMRSDPQVMQFIPRPLAKTPDDVRELITMLNGFVDSNERINWAIEWKESGKVVGMVGYVNIKPDHDRAEVGYSLSKAWHRKGIMREALDCILAYGFDSMQLHSIEAIVDEQNIASGSLLETAGFRKEACFIEDFYHGGRYRNSVHYGLLRREWQQSAAVRNAPRQQEAV
jgi:ribosomal-protein-alanine N-acetyltransferase